MMNDLHEESELISLDFVDEAAFEQVLIFCTKADFSERSEFPRRLLKNEAAKSKADVFKATMGTNTTEIAQDEEWKIAFFDSLTLE